jgi:type II secretory pathway pseudopilin PulG
MRRGRSGFTLIEVTIILMVLAILGMILLPVMQHWIEQARLVKVREDLIAIGSTIPLFLNDIGESCFWLNASTLGAASGGGGIGQAGPPARTDSNRIELLIGNGDIPPGNGSPLINPWVQPYSIGNGTFDVDFLEYHLCTNTPGGGIGVPYRRVSSEPPSIGASQGGGFARPNYGYFNSPFGWRGAYMTAPINPDPWGNRYMINAEFLDASPDLPGNYNNMAFDVVVLSAGINEITETPFAMDGAAPGGDDQIYVISGGAH